MKHLFYHPELEASQGLVILDKQEAVHCFRVLRLQEGDEVCLTNGRGLRAKGSLRGNMSSGEIEISDMVQCPDPTPSLIMAVAPTKNADRFEWFAEKATELGVGCIVPLVCSRSERKSIQPERIKRVMIAAMKQSEKFFLPQLLPETRFETFISENLSEFKLIAWCGEEGLPHLNRVLPAGKDVCILIGPEGDFSKDELILAKSNGFVPINLGNSRLRTETAALTACALFNAKQESV